jgi:hypothetical protein
MECGLESALFFILRLRAVKVYNVRRKDLDHVPFQFYIAPDGTETPLAPGYTGVFTITPFRGQIDTFYVRVEEGLIQEFKEKWEIERNELVRVCAKVAEAWLKDEPIPADHFYGPEWVRLDGDWYPHDARGKPLMAPNPYSFEVASKDPGFSILDWDFNRKPEPESPSEPGAPRGKQIVFGYTLDVFPAMLVVACEQLKRKVARAGADAHVQMLPLTELPADTFVLFVPPILVDAAHQAAPGARIEALGEMVNLRVYDALVEELSKENKEPT